MREISILKERILQYLDIKGISKYEFYQKTGVSNGILSQKNGLSEENTMKFLSYYNDINSEWLLTGKGDMLKKENPVYYKDSQNHSIKGSLRDLSEENTVPKGVPLIPAEAMAGYATEEVQVMDYDIKEDYIITPEFADKGIKYLIRVSGSSMVPKYNNGDLLACRPITDISFMQWGKVYVLDTDQGPLVKRLYECSPDELECRSDNYDKYPPFKILKESIRRIAIVVGVLRLE